MSFRSTARVWACAVVLTGAIGYVPNVSLGADGASEAKAAVLAYKANVDSFSHYSCRYRYTKGTAKSIEAALRGELVNGISYDNRLLVNGEWEMYEALGPEVRLDKKQAVPMPGKRGAFMVPALVDSDRYLCDGKREVNFCPQLRSLGLWVKGEGEERSIGHSPLGMHFVGHRSRHGPNVYMMRPDAMEMVNDGVQEIDGRPVVAVRFKKRGIEPPSHAKKEYVFSFDISRGHLPIRMTSFANGKPTSRVFVTHVRECSNLRWFPERSVVVDTLDGSDKPSFVAELKVLELDVDNRPAADQFAIYVPAGTEVSYQQRDKAKSFRLKQDENVRLEDISTLAAMLDKKQLQPLMDTAIPRSKRTGWMWVVAGVGLVLVGAIILHRARTNKRPATATE